MSRRLCALTFFVGLGWGGVSGPAYAANSSSSNHYYLAPGVGTTFLYSDLTQKKALNYGVSGLIRGAAEKRGFLTVLEGSYGMYKGIGSLTRSNFSLGILLGLYSPSIDGFYVAGADFSAYNNYRKTSGGNARFGIIKDMSDTMQWTIEGRISFMSSEHPSTGVGYGSRGYGVMFGLLFPFRTGPIPADRDAPLIEEKRRAISF